MNVQPVLTQIMMMDYDRLYLSRSTHTRYLDVQYQVLLAFDCWALRGHACAAGVVILEDRSGKAVGPVYVIHLLVEAW